MIGISDTMYISVIYAFEMQYESTIIFGEIYLLNNSWTTIWLHF